MSEQPTQEQLVSTDMSPPVTLRDHQGDTRVFTVGNDKNITAPKYDPKHENKMMSRYPERYADSQSDLRLGKHVIEMRQQKLQRENQGNY